MAGTVDVMQRCYTGIELRDGVLRLSPRLPEPLRRLRLFVRSRGQSLAIELGRRCRPGECDALPGPSGQVAVNGETYDIAASESRTFRLK